MIRAVVVVPVLLALAAGSARGEQPSRSETPEGPEGSRAHCRYVQATAAGERALLLAPRTFGRAGLVPVGEQDQTGDPLALDPKLRLTFGLEYSISDAWRGHLVGREADATCQRARAQEAADAALRAGQNAGRIPALRAKEALLEHALPAAEERLASVRQLVDDGVLTDQDLVAVETQVERLRTTRHATRREREVLEADEWNAGAEPRPVSQVAAALTTADLQLEQVRGDQRRARAWDLSVSAGVDAVGDNGLGVAPYGLVRFSFNFGYLWQGKATRRARRALADQVRADERAPVARAARLRAGLDDAHATTRSALRERRTFLAGITERTELLGQVDTVRSRLHQDVLWFTGVLCEADIAYLNTYAAELERYAGEAFAPSELRGTSFGPE